MEVGDLWAALETASRFDATVRVDHRLFERMLRRYVAPIPYSRATLFRRMYAAEPSVVKGFAKPLRAPFHELQPVQAGYALIDWLARRRSRQRHRVRTGTTGRCRLWTLNEIASQWHSGRTRFGVTDLHIRDTVMEEVIAPEVLSGFNLLTRSSPGARRQEMFSFVISSRGHLTDSHSDAPDSSNFCFAGRKLWLAWDTYEGARYGLQDVERAPVEGRARFDMQSWLSLRSARWLLVNPGETLFLPANMTHKVITLESYIGVGGFFLAIPNSLRLLSHWIVRAPLWSKRDLTGEHDNLVGEIADSVRDLLMHLPRASMRERRQLGYDYLERSAAAFIETCPIGQLRSLWSDPRFRRVAEVMPAPWPESLPGRQSRSVCSLQS
ncbi:MAG TPA: hypothetical protein VLA85_06400 [Verrucomicrobiae bacterium]|nr:hypothetical protein [Verrucomicrobiae bacterium]